MNAGSYYAKGMRFSTGQLYYYIVGIRLSTVLIKSVSSKLFINLGGKNKLENVYTVTNKGKRHKKVLL